jgi:TetR/AcrR family tetracycline transcriptional repressor
MQKTQIVQTALDILDRDGLEGVTLRRLAGELNVKAASIYWHIANKEALLDEMANAILEQHFAAFDLQSDQRDWAEWLDTLAHELRRAMLAHREGARVVAGAHLNIAVVLARLLGLTVRVLHRGGFSYSKAASITVTITTFTFGYVIEEQARPPHNLIDQRLREVFAPAESFRAVAEAMDAWREEGEDEEARFDTGVRIIINGARAELGTAGARAG